MKSNTVFVEYVKRLPEETLSELRMRFRQDLAGDKAIVHNIVSQDKDVDRWLKNAVDSDEFAEMMDQLSESLTKEHNRRESVQDYKKKK
jgi:hypothetical protein